MLKAMSKEPAERYATAEEFAADLERFCERRKIKAQRRGLADRLARWLRRHPAGLGVAATAMIALLVMAVGFATYSALLRRTVRERDESNARLEVANIETANALRESKEAGERADRALQESRQQVYAQDIEHAAAGHGGGRREPGLQPPRPVMFPATARAICAASNGIGCGAVLSGTGRTLHVSQKPVYDAEYSPDGLQAGDGRSRRGPACVRHEERTEAPPRADGPDRNQCRRLLSGREDDRDDAATMRRSVSGTHATASRGCASAGPKGRHAFSVLFTPDGRQIVTTWQRSRDPDLEHPDGRLGGGAEEFRRERLSHANRTDARRQDAGVGERRRRRAALGPADAHNAAASCR